MEDALKLCRAAAAGKFEIAVSALTVANVFYVTAKLAGKDRALAAVDQCLASFDVLAIDRAALEHARQAIGPDFEDGIQVAVATANRIDRIVTRDAAGFASAALPVLSAERLSTELQL